QHPDLHSLPTRRSSDLPCAAFASFPQTPCPSPSGQCAISIVQISQASTENGVISRGGRRVSIRSMGQARTVPICHSRQNYKGHLDRKSTRLNSSHVKIT